MGLINWILDRLQRVQIDRIKYASARAEVAQASMRDTSSAADVARLERALGELSLATRAVHQLLIEKGVCSSEEFGRKLRGIEREDGLAEGRAKPR